MICEKTQNGAFLRNEANKYPVFEQDDMRVDAKNQVSKHPRAQRPASSCDRSPVFPRCPTIGRFLGKTLLRRQTWDSALEFGAWIGYCEEKGTSPAQNALLALEPAMKSVL